MTCGNPHLFKTDENGKQGYQDAQMSSQQLVTLGNPIYDWKQWAKMATIERLREKLQDLRLTDHFRGFESYWKLLPFWKPQHQVNGSKVLAGNSSRGREELIIKLRTLAL